MTLKKDKLIALILVAVMFILTFAYMAFLFTTSMLIMNEAKTDRPVNVTIVYNVQPPVNEVKPEEPKTKEVSVAPKPEVKEEVKPEPKPVVKPKEETKVAKATSNDAYLLAQIINAEAKGEPYNGKVAVGNVVMNRVNHPNFPDTVKEVIFQKGQFYPVTNGTINNKPSEEAIKAANEVLSGKQIVGKQALYFYNPETSTSDWIFTRKTITDIGNHRFAY